MKAVFLMTDTFRRDHLGAYGNKTIHTPNLDRLAAMSNVFDHAYAGSFPTLPNRRDMHLGVGEGDRRFNRWKRIEDNEITLAERLGEKNVHTMMINDVANTVTSGKNFYKGFGNYRVNRGQEGDNVWSDESVPFHQAAPGHLYRYTAERWGQVLVNRHERRNEDDWFAPRTYKWGCDWLERNWRRENFLLWLETFDPHEPWDPPDWYTGLYDSDFDGRVFEAPTYGYIERMGITAREARHIHARYCGEVTMVDAAVGRVLRTLEKIGILDEVAIFFTSDHGAYFNLEGDNGLICKPNRVGADGMLMSAGGKPKPPYEFIPLYTGTMRLPLLIRLPRQRKSRRIRPIAQPWDIAPTVMDLFGLKAPAEFFGESLTPLMEGGKLTASRPFAFNGASPQGDCCRQAINRDWLYSVWPEGSREPALFDLRNNPAQDRNLATERPEVCRRLHKRLRAFDPMAGDCPL